jgi:8-oxo-dGTP pyrophosphatase MutT (NUDIX family)
LANSDIAPWQVLLSSIVYKNRWLRVRRDRCRTNRGNLANYYVVERASYVMVVALTSTDDVLVVEQYKHGAGRVIRELPAGFIEPGEDPLACAHRELQEETGYHAGRMEHLATFVVSPSTSQHSAHVFLASQLEPAASQHLDPNERINVGTMPFDEAVDAVLHNHTLTDLSSATALLLAWQHRHAARPGGSPRS